jgi:lipid-A-disaccharide synthase
MREIHPALFIGIDAPDFNLSLEANLKSAGIKTVHYVSPSVWAWRGWRMRHIARAADHVLVLFPFEETLYRNAGVPVSYVGHPLADIISEIDQTAAAREQLKIPSESTVVALLPGSRQSELQYMAAIFVRTALLIARLRPSTRFLVPLISRETRDLFERALYAEGGQDLPLTILFGHSRDAIAASNAVLVGSGTATLEVALHRKPMVISYRMAPITWRIMQRMRYQPWVGLPNIIAGRFLVPELLQEDAEPENLAQAVINTLADPCIRERLPEHLGSMHRLLKCAASERAAEAILQCINQG